MATKKSQSSLSHCCDGMIIVDGKFYAEVKGVDTPLANVPWINGVILLKDESVTNMENIRRLHDSMTAGESILVGVSYLGTEEKTRAGINYSKSVDGLKLSIKRQDKYAFKLTRTE